MTYQEEIQEGRRTLDGIVTALAKLMPGWQAGLTTEDNNRRTTLTKGPLEIGFQLERGKKNRLSIRAGNWPSYTSVDSRGDERTSTVWPHELWPKERKMAVPEITVDAGKTADQVKRDLERRLLPDYETAYARCAESAAAHQTYSNRTEQTWAEVCAVSGGDVNRTSHTVKINGIGEYSANLVKQSTYAELKIEVNAAQLAKIIEVLGGLRS